MAAPITHIAWLLVLVALLTRALQESLQANAAVWPGIGAAEGNILLLTAHPDDECMFFAPTLLGIRRLAEESLELEDKILQPNVFSLCLSVGNADRLGDIRRKELARSLDVLGIDQSRRYLIDSPDLQDSITSYWDEGTVARAIEPVIIENNITVILTFDSLGISNHPNHKSLPRGVLHFIHAYKEKYTTPPPRLFTLISHPLADKYIGVVAPLLARLDIVFGGFLQRHGFISEPSSGLPVFVAGIPEYLGALHAMLQHKSQLVWFRWLYVSFSRYMWVNEWVELVPQAEEA